MLGWVDSALIRDTMAARDSERRADMNSVARIYEDYYKTSPSPVGATYPTVSQAADLVSDKSLLTPPSSDSPQFFMADNALAPTPAVDQYYYQPFNPSDELCTAAPCVRFVLYFREEINDTVNMVESERQQ